MPGQVADLTCPDSADGGVLQIRWGLPSNAASVNDYVVEVEVYVQPAGSAVLEPRPLTTPYKQPVKSLNTDVTSGVSKWLVSPCGRPL